jgi:flagellar motility protein MotE (MotC chaperone)
MVYVSRLVRLPLLDAKGTPIGRVVDVVIGPASFAAPPRVVGFVVGVERRRIFVNAARVDRLDASGVTMRSGAIDIRQFHKREGELLADRDLLDRRFGNEIVNDVGLRSADQGIGWVVANVSLRPPGPIRRRSRARLVPWQQAVGLFDLGEVGREIAALRDLHPSDIAARLRDLPLVRRRRIAMAMEDEQFADVLEELSEDEQLELLADIDPARVADVLEEMAPDDAADLLGEMDPQKRVQLLDAMEPDEAEPVRRLLLYDSESAGGLMTPGPVIVTPDTTVAECLARLRNPDLPASIAAHVFVAEAPNQTPTGPYHGAVGFQRLLREPPGMRVEGCVEDHIEPIRPDLPATRVAERLAAYNLVALPVCDDAGRLVGAVTVDDVLDRALPDGWRETHHPNTRAPRRAARG